MRSRCSPPSPCRTRAEHERARRRVRGGCRTTPSRSPRARPADRPGNDAPGPAVPAVPAEGRSELERTEQAEHRDADDVHDDRHRRVEEPRVVGADGARRQLGEARCPRRDRHEAEEDESGRREPFASRLHGRWGGGSGGRMRVHGCAEDSVMTPCSGAPPCPASADRPESSRPIGRGGIIRSAVRSRLVRA